MLSIVANDIGFSEGRPIDLGQEQVRTGAHFPGAPFELLVDHKVQRLPAMRARGGDFHFQGLVSQAPFDEGRAKGIFRSSAKDPLPRAEPQRMRRAIGSYRKGPAYLAEAVTHQEEQMFFQVLEQSAHYRHVQPE